MPPKTLAKVREALSRRPAHAATISESMVHPKCLASAARVSARGLALPVSMRHMVPVLRLQARATASRVSPRACRFSLMIVAVVMLMSLPQRAYARQACLVRLRRSAWHNVSYPMPMSAAMTASGSPAACLSAAA